MAIDGKWEITINSPLGAQKATLDLKADGGTLNGTQTAMQGTQALANGKIDGNNLAWSASITHVPRWSSDRSLVPDRLQAWFAVPKSDVEGSTVNVTGNVDVAVADNVSTSVASPSVGGLNVIV